MEGAMLDFSDMNYWAVAVATVINMCVGSLWYSRVAFGKTWSRLVGHDMMKMPKPEVNKALAVTVVGAVIQSTILAVIVNSLHLTTGVEGFKLGLLIWLGFIAATTISDALYARRGWKLWWLNASYFLVVLLVNSVLLATWQ